MTARGGASCAMPGLLDAKTSARKVGRRSAEQASDQGPSHNQGTETPNGAPHDAPRAGIITGRVYWDTLAGAPLLDCDVPARGKGFRLRAAAPGRLGYVS